MARTSEIDIDVDLEGLAEQSLRGDEYVGQYRLCFELASGGMASVFLARSEGMAGIEKIAAVKRIHPHLSKERAFVDMFLDEARITSRITHANVCSVFDFGEVKGHYFIAMEYLIGETVSKVIKALRRCPDPIVLRDLPKIATRIIADICEGLHAAHELRDVNNELLGVVHRDVSPQNLFVTYDGVAKVVDFGVALARGRLQQTTAGQIKGKHAYMTPEQLSGDDIDRRADVFSLGVVLWELLVLKKLFKGRTEGETLLNILQAPIPKPSSIRTEIPKELDAVLYKALTRDPDDRYPTARDLGKALLNVQARLYGPVGLGEVEEWMSILFEGEAVRKKALVDVARSLSGPIARLHDDEESMGSIDSSTDTSMLRDAYIPPPLPKPPRLSRTPLVLFLASLAIGLFIGTFIVLAMQQESTSGDLASISTNLPPLRPQSLQDRSTDASADSPSKTPPPPGQTDDGEAITASGDGATSPDDDPGGQPTPTKVAPRATGFVSVATPGGWADVYSRGRRLGQTPLRAKLPVGRQVLSVRPFGKGPARTVSVTVVRSEVKRVVVRVGD